MGGVLGGQISGKEATGDGSDNKLILEYNGLG